MRYCKSYMDIYIFIHIYIYIYIYLYTLNFFPWLAFAEVGTYYDPTSANANQRKKFEVRYT
jgi:hypothetical protein